MLFLQRLDLHRRRRFLRARRWARYAFLSFFSLNRRAELSLRRRERPRIRRRFARYWRLRLRSWALMLFLQRLDLHRRRCSFSARRWARKRLFSWASFTRWATVRRLRFEERRRIRRR